MGCLFGFISVFLGASVLNITGGVPFLPLQTLWINFTTLLFQAIGLGYGKPAPDLMKRAPRRPEDPIIDRRLMLRLIVTGLVIGAGTLGVLSWAEEAHNTAIAHTMGVVTFSLFALFFSIATRDDTRSIFSLETFSDRTFNLATIASVGTLILSTVLAPLQSFLDTVPLDLAQWSVCVAVAASVVVISEIAKALARRTAAAS